MEIDWSVRRHEVVSLNLTINNNNNWEEGVKPKRILKKEMAETGNFNINDRTKLRVKCSPTTSSAGERTESGNIEIKGIFAE